MIFRFITMFLVCFLGFSVSGWADSHKPVYQWKMATAWPGGEFLEHAKLFAEHVNQMTHGRVEVKTFPGGAIGNPLKVTETVGKGVAQIGHTWAGYDWGKNKASVLFAGWAGGLDAEQTFHWLYEAGGQELYQQFRQEKFNLTVFPAGVGSTEVFLHSQKPVKTLEDLKGLKIRTAGAWLEISKEVGTSPVTASGSEVYQMLERGVIDATEWGSPAINLPIGFHKIAPYVIIPGIHQPTGVLEVVINEKAWNELSDHDQKMIELAAKLASLEYWTKNGYQDFKAIKVFQDNGNKIIKLDENVKQEVRRLSNEWADKIAQENEWFDRVLNHQRDFQKLWESGEAYRDVR